MSFYPGSKVTWGEFASGPKISRGPKDHSCMRQEAGSCKPLPLPIAQKARNSTNEVLPRK